jgi:hypothetical protein
MPSPRLANHFAGLVPERLPDLPIDLPFAPPVELDFSLDLFPTTEAEATEAEAWTVRRHGSDGLEVVLTVAAGPRREGTFRLTTAQRLQLIVALEEHLGVPIDGPVRRELLADDTLSAKLLGGVITYLLDCTDGEVLFGAPMYHAWLTHQEMRRLERLTHPGAARDAL